MYILNLFHEKFSIFSFLGSPNPRCLVSFNCSFIHLWLCHAACGILVPRPGMNPLQQKHQVLTTEMPGNSPDVHFEMINS